MNPEIILVNLLSPPVLFYFVGIAAALFKSDLQFPQPLPKLFSLYLLFAIGIKGGLSLAESGITFSVLYTLLAALALSVIVPMYTFFILRLRFGIFNSAAVAATYGSISAVTFITAGSFLDSQEIPYGGHLVTAMALMEAPAIIIAVVFVGLFHKQADKESRQMGLAAPAAGERGGHGIMEIIKDALLNGSVFLLLSSLLIGFIADEKAVHKLEPFTHEMFYGVLCFFLLDMGLVSVERLGALRQAGKFAVSFSVVVPLLNASLGIGLSVLLGLQIGDALMLTVLAASASYIAVPAALRLVMPQADAGLYVPMSLALTFPFNIVIGIPIYYNALLAVL
ncbi:MAG: sodium-dependent bicarbonate transport family permease [bacterium]|nr:sodium-dependent bicarbonate transport family permease [bacterium]